MTTFIPVVTFWLSQTENVGFEPTVPYGITGFQDQRLQPLGQLSEQRSKIITRYLQDVKMFSEFIVIFFKNFFQTPKSYLP